MYDLDELMSWKYWGLDCLGLPVKLSHHPCHETSSRGLNFVVFLKSCQRDLVVNNLGILRVMSFRYIPFVYWEGGN